MQTVGKALVAIGLFLQALFPNQPLWVEIGQFLEQAGTDIIAGKGSVGPIRVGSLGLTLNVAPWKDGQ